MDMNSVDPDKHDNRAHDVYFDTRFQFDKRRDKVWKEVCQYIQKKFVPNDSRVLDLGSGYCDFINNVQASKKYAVDLFSEMPKYAADDVTTYLKSCTNLDFLDENSIDVVFASNLFEHLSRDDFITTLKQVERVMVPGGTIIALQPNFKYCYRSYFDDYTHIQIFTEEALCDLFKVYNFTTFKCIPRFLPVNMKSTLKLGLPFLHLLTRLYLNFPIRPLARQMLVVARNDNS